jgi:hypothetical protein
MPVLLRYADVVLLLLAAPIVLLIGASAVGYGVGAGAWIVLRVVGVGVDRVADAASASSQISLRLGYLMGRLFLLALAVILVRNGSGRDAGLTCLLVIVFAFTIALASSIPGRAGRR